jgi:hypothetical protein
VSAGGRNSNAIDDDDDDDGVRSILSLLGVFSWEYLVLLYLK